MRGGEWHKYWYPGKAGLPSVTIDIKFKTMVAYIDKGQTIVERSKEEAEKIAWYAIFQAKDRFIEDQALFGITFEIENVGQQIGKGHGGLVIREDGPFGKEDPVTPGVWIDKSVNKELGPGYCEVEMFGDNPRLTRVEKGLFAIEKFPDMPEAMKKINETLNPLSDNVAQVKAMLQGGITISAQYEQMLNFMTKVLTEMAEMRKENAELKARLSQ